MTDQATATLRPFDWCARDNGPLIARQCVRCEAVHLCPTLLSDCRCHVCSSDWMETV